MTAAISNNYIIINCIQYEPLQCCQAHPALRCAQLHQASAFSVVVVTSSISVCSIINCFAFSIIQHLAFPALLTKARITVQLSFSRRIGVFSRAFCHLNDAFFRLFLFPVLLDHQEQIISLKDIEMQRYPKHPKCMFFYMFLQLHLTPKCIYM